MNPKALQLQLVADTDFQKKIHYADQLLVLQHLCFGSNQRSIFSSSLIIVVTLNFSSSMVFPTFVKAFVYGFLFFQIPLYAKILQQCSSTSECDSNTDCFSMYVGGNDPLLRRCEDGGDVCICLPRREGSSDYQECYSGNRCGSDSTCFIPNNLHEGKCLPCNYLSNREQSEIPRLVEKTNCSLAAPDPVTSKSSCKTSNDCFPGDNCLTMSSDGNLVACDGYFRNANREATCFCDEYGPSKGSSLRPQQPGSCNTDKSVCQLRWDCYTNTPLYREICVPCSLIKGTPNEKEMVQCAINLQIPKNKNGKLEEQCSTDKDCSGQLKCQQIQYDGIIRECNGNIEGACFCYRKFRRACNRFNPCMSSHDICAQLEYYKLCVPKFTMSSEPPLFQEVETINSSILYILLVVELSFIGMKVAIQNNRNKRIRQFSAFCFVIESIAGIGLTAIQGISIAMVQSRSANVPVFFAVGLFALSELMSILSEGFNLSRRIKFGPPETPLVESIVSNGTVEPDQNDQVLENGFGEEEIADHKRFTRISVIKWISTVLSILLLILCMVFISCQDTECREANLSGVRVTLGFSLVAVIFQSGLSIVKRRKYKLRFYSSLFILSLTAVLIALGVFHPTAFHKSCDFGSGSAEFPDFSGSVSPFVFAVSILLAAIAAFGIKGASQIGVVSRDQVDFTDIVTVGIEPPMLTLATSGSCPDDIRNILIVGFPQAVVLLVPLLMEFFMPLFTLYAKKLKIKIVN